MHRLTGPYASASHRKKYPFVVLEGISGVGKSTLTSILREKLNATTLHTLPHPMTQLSAAMNQETRPLPQFAFYLSGVLHSSDLVREAWGHRPVIADRYVSSVIACHSAVHHLPVEQVTALLDPFRSYLATPDHTFYLRCSEESLRSRMESKTDIKSDDTDLFDVPGRMAALVTNFDSVCRTDPTTTVLDTDDQTPEELAAAIIAALEPDRAQSD